MQRVTIAMRQVVHGPHCEVRHNDDAEAQHNARDCPSQDLGIERLLLPIPTGQDSRTRLHVFAAIAIVKTSVTSFSRPRTAKQSASIVIFLQPRPGWCLTARLSFSAVSRHGGKGRV